MKTKYEIQTRYKELVELKATIIKNITTLLNTEPLNINEIETQLKNLNETYIKLALLREILEI